ncbi:MAG: hypothetical protein A2381_08075 [Bdellovibrionales bacterium RIFOXYB1_FULL_37_110]|nr:MAG: hypothetical protein A2181_04840 [Bdellovibrionales bacterium RIFOXYA1_FULL_38_20]OFZ52561.1 MAG: hypothetical protein A2417_00795 [Bdellovibrionales bacterium RIFOXYC1_FULL_37_79]OFZ59763.1 MAG: hypothetical protein A2381_08075 [Bdellovibrionales bacterium RIFOXYB1_FULL_37_110]OFZ65330.1 MAG: hypothetical protein A2577_04255 [Bdellovibrionales bacterium RIFOXYD1_FULL_36_51]
MLRKKIYGFILCLLFGTLAYADNFAPVVKLVKGEIIQTSSSGGSFQVTVALNNIAYDKKVEVIYKLGNGAWEQPLKAKFESNTGDNMEIWSMKQGNLGEFISNPVHFYIRYEIPGGQFAIDDNCGDYYLLDVSAFMGEDDISVVEGSNCR